MRRYEVHKNQGISRDDVPAIASQPDPGCLPDGNGGSTACPELLTEEELVRFLRIPKISKARDYHNVVENLKRMHDLPRIHICGKPLYPRDAIKQWIRERTTNAR
jgi:hypothetical protein